MSARERKFQQLWISAILGSFIAFLAIKFIWADDSYSFLLVFLLVGFVINFMISTIRAKKYKEEIV